MRECCTLRTPESGPAACRAEHGAVLERRSVGFPERRGGGEPVSSLPMIL